jgi:hypothetical protein
VRVSYVKVNGGSLGNSNVAVAPGTYSWTKFKKDYNGYRATSSEPTSVYV